MKFLISTAALLAASMAAEACGVAGSGLVRRAVSRTVSVVRVRPVAAVPVGAFYLPPPVLVAPQPMPAVAPPKVAAPPAVKTSATEKTVTTTKTTATSSVTVKPAVRRTLLPRLFPVRGCEGGNCPAR